MAGNLQGKREKKRQATSAKSQENQKKNGVQRGRMTQVTQANNYSDSFEPKKNVPPPCFSGEARRGESEQGKKGCR